MAADLGNREGDLPVLVDGDYSYHLPAPGRFQRAASPVNNLVKRVKRGAFGSRRFRNYRNRSLLYARRPGWSLLTTITPR